jgi:RES domain-containing protein
MIVAYRVCKTRYPVFDGSGAEIVGGRWNSPGRPLIYCSDSFAGALLEILVHANAPVALPGPHHCARAFIEAETSIEALEEADLPGWADENALVSRAFGDRWLDEQRTAILSVPAATARPYGRNLLLNPRHPDYGRLVLETAVEVRWDARLFRGRWKLRRSRLEIRIPRTHDALTPILASVPLQLLAYHIAVLRGANVDQPRNLAKSVTVE